MNKNVDEQECAGSSTKCEEIRIVRTFDLDLVFEGRQIAQSEHKVHGADRGVEVTIYVTAKGGLVTKSIRWFKSEDQIRKVCRAEFNTYPESALSWLRGDTKSGCLGAASKMAWEEACRRWDPLKRYSVERIF